MSAVDVLKAARERLTPEGAWTQGVYARNVARDPVDSLDPDAVCWCAIGAIRVAAGDHEQLAADAAKALKRVLPGVRMQNRIGSLVDFNDTHTKAEVLEAFDAAIEATS